MGFRFSVLGIPVQVDAWFFVLPLMALQSRSWEKAAVWTVVVFTGVMFHELGHALTMRAFGFAPSITLHGLGGLTHFPRGARPTPGQQVLITLAGPTAGLVLGSAVWVTQQVLVDPSPLVSLAMSDALWVNFLWSLINVLPVLPWDGGMILDSGLEWGLKRQMPRVVGAVSLATGLALVAFAIPKQLWMLGYFGVMGIVYGYRRYNASGPQTQVRDDYWARINAGEDVAVELETRLAAQVTPVDKARYSEWLAWARLFKKDYAGARQAVALMGDFMPSVSLRARLAAGQGDTATVIALLSPSGVAKDDELPLLVSALISEARYAEVVGVSGQRSVVAEVAGTRLFHAGAFEEALQVLKAERLRTGQGRFAYNEACCLCRLGRLDEAVAALVEAKRLGCLELADVEKDDDLAAVRERPEVRGVGGGPLVGLVS